MDRRSAWFAMHFNVLQHPEAWFSSAERLMEAAEIIYANQLPVDIAHQKATEAAEQEAAITGYAEIESPAPNYMAADLLSGYALENILKGLMVRRNTRLIQQHKLHKSLKSHQLTTLADQANVSTSLDERRALRDLSVITVWGGRYPVAIDLEQHTEAGVPTPSLGREQRRIVREIYARARTELQPTLSLVPYKGGGVVVDLTNVRDAEL